MYNIGFYYSSGKGVNQSNDEAMKWYRKAADKGHVRAAQIIEKQ